MRIFDITIPLCAQTPVWQGDKKVSIQRTTTIAPGEEYNVSEVEMGVHAGTHIDAPFHVLADGRTVDQIPLERLLGKAQVIQIADEVACITREILDNSLLESGIQRILFKTRNSRRWDENPFIFRSDFVGLDADAAQFLVERGIFLTGIDGFTISNTDEILPTHRILLESGVVILENLDLRDVPAGVYDLYCLPLKLIGTDGAPVRAILTRIE